LVATDPGPPHLRGDCLSAALREYQAAIVHHIPGRVRLKVPRAYRDPSMLRRMKDAFDAVPAIKASEIRSSSASLVLYYDECNLGVRFTFDAMLRGSQRTGFGETLSLDRGSAAQDLGVWLVSVSSKLSSTRSMAPIILAAAALLEVSFAAAPPLWLRLMLLFLTQQQRSRPA
jgi:hypothetical protein